MSDQDDDKKILNEDSTDSKSDDQPSVVENNQPESVDSSNDELSDSQNVNKEQNDDKKEVLEAKKTFQKYKWPLIDVTRKSVEETAASIIKIHEIYSNNAK